MSENEKPKGKKLIIESDDSNKVSEEVSEGSSLISDQSSDIPSSTTEEGEETEEEMDYDLETQFKKLNGCKNEDYYSPGCNKFLLKKEILESEELSKDPEADPYLYPNLSDKNFNIKIASKKEFNDTKYEGPDFSKSIKEQAKILAEADFELQPHQAFVKNFMSFQTPYNSLLLYHGLGSGKTCSAIGVCEEMRDYMKQMGINKRIIIVASENVQDNFKLQLFDERKLKLIDGVWNIRACTGNKLLQEINPMNMRGMSKEKVVSQIKSLINSYYIFLGYGQFANYIIKTMNYSEEIERKKIKYKKGEKPQNSQGEKTKIQMLKDIKITLNSRIIRRLRNEFDDRLIVIDEVHNIRKTDDNENKKVAVNLELLVKAAENMRFLLLSATPMYNSYKEIIWLLNLMNTNDRRGRIEVRNVFDKNGNFKKKGEDLLIRKATGYISFVRGENPYTFPYRVYPNDFAKDHTFKKFNKDKVGFNYPSYKMNLKPILNADKKRILSLYLNRIENCKNCGQCQYCCYKYIIYNLRNKNFTITTKKGLVRDMPNFENMESFGYTLLQTPLESLIISYPIEGLKSVLDEIPEEKKQKDFDEEFSKASILSNKDEVEEAEDETPGLVNESEVVSELEETESKTKGRKSPNTLADKWLHTAEKILKKAETLLPSAEILIPSLKAVEPKEKKETTIDPHLLTGKQGLGRMMNFVDEKSPPEKGQFEYKKSTLDKYKRIFSQELIGNYSSKIKCILDNIVNPKTDYISKGIILIYSQYIDSGLIPVALALEEMGFTRYGENVKPLFKKRPTDVVDVKTMKPPINKQQFMPARYSIITGDPRISPNNDFEVKGLTGEDNKDGYKVKVVLISKAGSEGIDLKFIRQVHILEPWYNMNRIEQIIGRAVRNFSHKDLDFEERNVEIFMHGTILGEENIEEAADLYVYRVAEFKAIQIGNVSRVLKETAVDCIINHDQTKFTQKIISENLKEPIKQILSDGKELPNFIVGDAPFSPACDYMATCNYSCRPDKDIDEEDLNEDTYNENFIVINSEKILQRIRMLMKESFFYKKDDLLNAIRTPKEYPYIQIFSALTQLIEDNNEFIADKYGRNGRLINIGEYYLFQPIELRDKNISIFDRSVPIDYKHEMINFEINKNIKKPVELQLRDLGEELYPEGKKIIDEFKANLDIIREYQKNPKGRVERGDDNWYKHCGIVTQKMIKTFSDLTREMLIEIVVSHMIEILMYEDKINVMNYLYSLDTISENSVEDYAKKYFENISINTSGFVAIILYNLNKRMIMILNEDNKWVEAGPEDQREIAMSKEAGLKLTFDKKLYNKQIGFIGYEKNNKYLTFKTKNIDSTRDTGARCDESGKEKIVKILWNKENPKSSILDEETYTKLITRPKLDKDGEIMVNEDGGKITETNISHTEQCVLMELILRFFNTIKREALKWIVIPELAIYYKLYKVL